MSKFLSKKIKGFTLVELMIVVAIIGILAAIAIPRFARLIDKSKEGATKGCLGAMRSAIGIYYGDNEGVWPPAGLADLTTNYIDTIPLVKLPNHILDTNNVVAAAADLSEWWYTVGDGKVVVNCTHIDLTPRKQITSNW